MSKPSISIAYSLKKKQNKAKGGEVESEAGQVNCPKCAGNPCECEPLSKPSKGESAQCPTCGVSKMSEGGEVADEQPNDFDYVEKDDLVARAMKKSKR